MEYWQKRQQDAETRLRAALSKPSPVSGDDVSVEFFDPWDDLIDGCVGGYSSEMDRLAIDVLKSIRDKRTFDLLKTDRALAAELLMCMLADWLCDYGTSPRGVFPASQGLRKMWDELITKWEEYADAVWGGDWRISQ